MVRYFHLQNRILRNNDSVYLVDRDDNGKIIPGSKKLMCRVICAATFYNDKGSAFFDKDFINQFTPSGKSMWYHICLDEMNREASEKKTFDIVYNVANALETLVRSTKKHIRIICIGNTLAESSDMLSTFNFIPQSFGRFILRKHNKVCGVVEYMEPTPRQKARREDTVLDILCGDSSTVTNENKIFTELVHKQSLNRKKMRGLIIFTKEHSDWFCLWDGDYITKYKGQFDKHMDPKTLSIPVYCMRRGQNAIYSDEKFLVIQQLWDFQVFTFDSLKTNIDFKKNMESVKPPVKLLK